MKPQQTYDLRAEFDKVIGVHPKGYRVRHIGVALYLDDPKGGPDKIRSLEEFMQADCPNNLYHARVAVAEFDGDTARARMAACMMLAKEIEDHRPANEPSILELGPLFPLMSREGIRAFVLREIKNHTDKGNPPDEVWFLDEDGKRICQWPALPGEDQDGAETS